MNIRCGITLQWRRPSETGRLERVISGNRDDAGAFSLVSIGM